MSDCSEILSPETRTVIHWFTLWNQEQRQKFLTHLRGFLVVQSSALELCNRLDLFWIASESQETFQCQVTMHLRGDLTRDAQMIYLSQWLGEFSEVEKDDFLQQLLDLYAPGQLAIGQRLAPMKSEDKVPTLFDCRIDLLKRWFESWEPNDRDEFLNRLKEADADFMEKYQKSKDTPNEDKIVEEFWLRLSTGPVETNPAERSNQGVYENGSAEIRVNGSVTVEENGVAADQDHANAPASLENGNADVLENGSERSQENGIPEVQDDVPLGRSASPPAVEVSSPMSETKEGDEAEPVRDLEASSTNESGVLCSHGEESQAPTEIEVETSQN
ncbi:uncharacterized protein LOC100897861 [Galendromus occidentalis]|uniref:Uncharacterized protein LOC100897861 n=1 Tax=Galendromus occidentalis TaxID=34638 RepID=A0AAJ7SE95_9ACAR|nr:uncharacterized protein LOC100897861 [Galendromus occidentalis]